MTTGKTIALTRRTFVGKVMSLFNAVYIGHNFPSKEQVSFNLVSIFNLYSKPTRLELFYPFFI